MENIYTKEQQLELCNYILDKAVFNINPETGERHFSVTMDKYTDFVVTFNVDFFQLWDEIPDEERTKLLNPYFEKLKG